MTEIILYLIYQASLSDYLHVRDAAHGKMHANADVDAGELMEEVWLQARWAGKDTSAIELVPAGHTNKVPLV